jgi:hypothetical protein
VRFVTPVSSPRCLGGNGGKAAGQSRSRQSSTRSSPLLAAFLQTVTNAVPAPELTFDEGRAVVSSMWPEIAVSARVYYTAGEKDERLHAISDSKVVVDNAANSGD